MPRLRTPPYPRLRLGLTQELEMKLTPKWLPFFALVAATAAPVLAEPVETEAVIVSTSGGQLGARTRQGDITVVFSSATAIRELDGLRRRTRDADSLIPGLIINVEGDRQGDTINAERIEFKERDWRTAVATRAGTTEQFAQNAAQLEELRNAIIDGQEYVIQKEVTVYFASGKSNVAAEYQAQLRTLAQEAPSFGNYRISILGFADQRGDPAANERLSARRAAAVSNYIRQTGSIEPGRVLSPSAMGEGTIAPAEAAPSSDAEARRVLVRVVTPKSQLAR
jgi:outer membrane protein OmpA-like peptidoglycan-associated protein